MPKFEVTQTIIIAFDAETAEEAKYLVESGETPRDHELVSAFVSYVEELPK